MIYKTDLCPVENWQKLPNNFICISKVIIVYLRGTQINFILVSFVLRIIHVYDLINWCGGILDSPFVCVLFFGFLDFFLCGRQFSHRFIYLFILSKVHLISYSIWQIVSLPLRNGTYPIFNHLFKKSITLCHRQTNDWVLRLFLTYIIKHWSLAI